MVLAVAGIVLIALRRRLGRFLLDWRNLFPPALRNPQTRAGEVILTLVGAFMLGLAVVSLIWS